MFNLKITRYKYLLPILLALGFFIIGILTISDYGINWDAPIRMMRGQAFLNYFLTGNTTYNQPAERLSPYLISAEEYASRYDFLEGEEGSLVKLPQRPLIKQQFDNIQKSLGRSSFYESNTLNADYFMKHQDGHPPLVDILAAGSNRLFYQQLNVLGDIESYQITYLLFSALGIFIVSLFTFEITKSYFATVIAGLCLAFFPIYLAESHFNMKDPVQASIFACSIYCYYKFVKDNKLLWGGLFFLSIIFALGTKWNIIFLPFILLPWTFFIRNTKHFKQWFKFKKLLLVSLLAISLTIILFPLIWPGQGSNNPLQLLGSLIEYYQELGTRQNSIQPEGFIYFGFNFYPTVLLILQTPEVILILFTVGLYLICKSLKLDLRVNLLLILWLLVTVIRQSLPHVWFYNGIRQIMEILPAMAIISGIGAWSLAFFVSSKLGKERSVKSIILLIFISTLGLINVTMHPNQNSYFNLLSGGPKGAYQRNLIDWSQTYGNIYRQGINWLNKNANKDANLAILNGSMYAISPVWLREDISFSPFHFSGFDKKGEYIMMLSNSVNPPVFAHRYLQQFLKPVYTVIVQGTSLLTIYKNDQSQTKEGFQDEKVLTDLVLTPKPLGSNFYLEIDLKKEVRVTKISLTNSNKNCQPIYTQYVDEFIEFKPGSKPYALQERRINSKGQLEFWFAGELSRQIKIYPQDRSSCFLGNKILSVSYFDL